MSRIARAEVALGAPVVDVPEVVETPAPTPKPAPKSAPKPKPADPEESEE